MTNSSRVFRVGTRSSPLAQTQTQAALEQIGALLPDTIWRSEPQSSPGDRDRTTDLRNSPPDFFTRDLDDAVRRGELDAALHSAKDVPTPLPEGLDWIWLPWREDPRDVLLLRAGEHLFNLPADPRIGVSSERRERYALERFPRGRMTRIRGNIESRLAQLDAGDVDVLVMAAAALLRLGLTHRISEWIPLTALPTPEGQGALCLTFRAGCPALTRLRSLFAKSVTFVGAGTGRADWCTQDGIEALSRCDVCLYDALLDPALLDHLPPDARRIAVGKRAGSHTVPQEETTRSIADEARKGRRVVRLKGGDPGIFGRLAEETDALDALQLPYRVVPAVSSLNAATSATGMLLTRRGNSRGFCVMTPRAEGGAIAGVGREARAELPLAFYMATQVVNEVATQLIEDGLSADLPAAVVYNAGAPDELIVRAPLAHLHEQLPDSLKAPGLLLVGDLARHGFCREQGALRNQRVLLTCSDALQRRADALTRELGGRPIRFPLIRLEPDVDAVTALPPLSSYDWIVIPSPAAVECLARALRSAGIDLRTLPRIVACGPPTQGALAELGLFADLVPNEAFGSCGTTAAGIEAIRPGERVVRICSDQASPDLARALRDRGIEVDECTAYRNLTRVYDHLPPCDAVFFASGSAVRAFMAQWGQEALANRTVLAIGPPTARELERLGRPGDLVAPAATVESALMTLAGHSVRRAIAELETQDMRDIRHTEQGHRSPMESAR